MFLTTICFKLDSLNGQSIVSLADIDSGFDIRWARGYLGNRQWNQKLRNDLQTELHCGNLEFTQFKGEESPSLVIARVGSGGFTAAYWTTSTPFLPSEESISKICEWPSFLVAYVADEEDIFWQSETSIATYRVHGIDYHNLPTIADSFGGIQIDVHSNPGRRVARHGYWIQASWRMWFGRAVYDNFPRENLLLFPEAHRILPVGEKAVFIELFEDPRSPVNVVRQKQIAFREWVKMDEVLAKPDQMSRDPVTDTSTIGPFFSKHAVLRYTEYLDINGNPCPRSRSAVLRITEFDAEDRVVYSD